MRPPRDLEQELGDRRWDPWRSRPRSAAVLVDFDGTLAPIVDDPATARPLDGVCDVLGALARRYERVAVVSGRPAAFLAEHLAVAGVTLSGLYGLERWRQGRVETDPAGERWRSVVTTVGDQAEHDAPPGVGVERKGLSVTLHVRLAPEHDAWALAWTERASARTGLVVHPARRSYEMRPPVNADKGTVVAGLGEGLAAVCFVGDDVGDLAAFAALDRLAVSVPPAATVRVAVASEESPPELLAAADLVVGGPHEAIRLLAGLASFS